MNSQSAVNLINVLGFLAGTALYGMLLAMTLEARRWGKSDASTNRLPLLTAICGLAWSLGSLAAFGMGHLRASHFAGALSLWLSAIAFAALGWLPAVVVHSVLRSTARTSTPPQPTHWLARMAYGLSAVAGLLHLFAALRQTTVPSHVALHLLTVGFAVLIVALLLLLRRQSLWRQAGWLIALAIFTVSAQHLSHHEGENYPWWLELIGHHSSLPLAFVILYQDYRFALADLFLKRALTLLTLVTLAGGLYATTTWLWTSFISDGVNETPAIEALLVLWLGVTLCYPLLQRSVRRFVDGVILQRVDYEAFRQEIARVLAHHEEADLLLEDVCDRLAQALTARDVWTQELTASTADTAPLLLFPLIQRTSRRHRHPRVLTPRAEVPAAQTQPHEIVTEALIPTSEAPQYRLLVGTLSGGRRLLSDDLAMIEAVAVLTARRIDALRVTHERITHTLREQEIAALATEAELKALRAQLNPHFLFNALTTIGWLIQSAPERALDTLMKLTTLLRGVLQHSDKDLTTLGAEIKLIEAYLEIERARFEDRLHVVIEVSAEAREIRLPSLLIQPLVENAIKHGITPQRSGGAVSVSAHLDHNGEKLYVQIRDTGAGTSQQQIQTGKSKGIGLANVERRLQAHYQGQAQMQIRTAPQQGMTIELVLPVKQADRAQPKRETFAAGRLR